MTTTTKATETNKGTAPVEKKPATTQFTAADLAKELGLPSPAVVRRYLRAAQIKKPKDGWVWPDKAAAKNALDALRRAQKAASP